MFPTNLRKPKDSDCFICKRILLWEKSINPYFIHEFENSILVLGDHQYFEGYSLLLLKKHVRELHELPDKIQINLYQELMLAGKAIHKTFRPWKMNYSCYGNTVEHVHWHIFPRYEKETDHKMYPWLHSGEFKNFMVDGKQAKDTILRIKKNL